MSRRGLRGRYARVFAALLLVGAMTGAVSLGQTASQNVNMVSGTGWTNGDPFLERQNEPSITVSTRNSAHLFGAANDYRSVDLPGLLGIDERGDAWLGVYKSFDGGLTWQSTLLPGFPLDGSPEGLASPIHGRQAAADPLVRAGSNGLFFLTGIAFDRGANPLSKVFISRFIDLNNKENGDAAAENGALTNLAPRDPVKYVDTHVIDSGSANRFLDKPWVAVDIPRGRATCSVSANEDGNIVTQRIPAGAIYVTYTAFTTVGGVQNSQILFRRSTDCGVTWSKPIVLSQNDDRANVPDAEGQGTVIAIDPSVPAGQPATIYVAWRVFAEPGDADDANQIRIAKSTNGGLSFDEQEAAVTFPLACNKKPTGVGCPFDQGETGTSFRSNGYPALTVDNAGRVYLAWSQRDANGDGRVMMTVTNSVESWPRSNFGEVDSGAVYDDYGNPLGGISNRGSQLMPTLNFNAGKLILTYYDLRQDHTSGMLTPAPEPTCDPAITSLCPVGNPFSELRQLESELLTNPLAVFNAYVDDATLTVRRHTLDIVGSEGSPDPDPQRLHLPSFGHFRVSRYEYGIIPPGADVQQAQFNAPNLPMFVQGTAPFMGDYIDVAGAPSMVPDNSRGSDGWKFNTSGTTNPVFHAAWTDNRDVLPPPDGVSWNKYTPPVSASVGPTSKFDPTQTPPACVAGYSGMRNQNIYTSAISQGLILTSPQTAKPVLQANGQPIPREFALVLRNDTNESRAFQLAIPAQPASAQASFLQFGLQTTLAVNIPALSSVSRPVFLTPNAGSTVSFPAFQVNASETDGAQPALTASILFNADPTNPFLANPDNAAFGGGSISSQEFYNPAILNPAILNPAILNPAILNPAILNPAILNPAILNPAILNPAILNPNFVVALNPAILNPAILNPAILNNAVANPAILNPAILNTPVSDANYTITNEGNTSATYQLQLFQSGALPGSAVFQIILTKTYLTPGVSPTDGCTYGGQINNEVIASIDNPVFVTDPTKLGNPAILNSAINNPTFSMAPGDTVQITLRANLTVTELANVVLPNLTPVVAAQAVNTVDVAKGITTPPISLLISTTTLPTAVTGQAYSAALAALGGNPPLTADVWSIVGGSLPPGLNLSAAGVISGSPTSTGTFPFVVEVTDSGAPQHVASRQLSITVVAPPAIQTQALPNAAPGAQYTQVVAVTGGMPPYTWSSTGTLPPGLTLSSTSGVISGVPTTAGTYPFTVRVNDSLGLVATASYTIVISTTVVQQPAQITFIVQPSNVVGGQSIAPAVQVQVFDVTGAAIPNTQVTASMPNPACPSAALSGTISATTNESGVASFANLSIDHGQRNYTIAATAGNAFGVSNPFNVEGYCETGSMNTARHNQILVALPNGKILVTGGAVNPNSAGALASAELYDPVAHSFTTISPMNVARADHTMTLLQNGTVLVAGGFNDNGVVSSAEVFDPTTNTFTLLAAAMTSLRAEHTATLLANGKVLIAGGNNNTTSLATAEIFDPSVNTFRATSHNMTAVRQIQHADLLPNGRVLISGGFDVNNNALASAEIYDPVADTFTATGSMSTARGNHASVLLYTGQILVAGGLTGPGTALASTATAELYNPGTGLFTPTGSMSIPRAHYSPTVLDDGTILIQGGATLPAGTNADVYDPATGTFSTTPNFTAVQAGMRDSILPDGTVLLTSGVNSQTVAVPNSEVFYPLTVPASIFITTSAPLPQATQDQPYTQLFLEFGGAGNLTWTVASGTLPTGLSLSPSGILTGVPTVSGTFTFTVNVVDGSTPQKSATSGTLTIVVSGVPLQFTSNAVPTAVAGRPYAQTLPVAGGTQPYNGTVTSGTLPPGMEVAGNMLLGTPSGAGNFTFTLKVTDASTPTQTATQTLTISVNTLVISTTVLPNGIVGVPYNAAINTAGGTLPLSFSLANTAFPPGLLIQQPTSGSSSGALAGNPTLAGVYTFSESVADSSNPQQTATQNYLVTIAPAGGAVPANITFVNQPRNSVGSQTISGGAVVVQVTDASNNPIPGTTVDMSLAGYFNPAPTCSVATLSGTLSAVTNAIGQATFSNLSIDRGGFNYTLLASTGSASQTSGPFSVQGFCASGNLSTQREGNTQDLLVTPQSIVKFPLDPMGAYIFTNTNPAPPGVPDLPHAPLILSLASLGIKPGDVISGAPVGDMDFCAIGSFCFGEVFNFAPCAVFSSSNTLLPSGETINRIPGAIAPNFTTAFPCTTPPTQFGNLPTDIPQDFVLFGEPVQVPVGAAYLFVGVSDSFYSDNSDANGDFGVAIAINSPSSVNGGVLIAGGVDNLGNSLNTAEIYNPILGFTSPTGNLTDPNGRADHVSVVLPNGQVLLIGGDNNSANALATAEVYNPATATFAATGSMSHARSLPTAVLLADGRVLVTGGLNATEVTNTAEIYDPATGVFTPTGNMNQTRTRHTMTLLPNGKVLVTGGRDADQNFFALSSAEIFDPFANQGVGAFTPIGNMNSPRFKHTATLLSNGKVLIAGGFNGGNTSLSVASAEIFDPSTNIFTPTGSMNTPRARHTATLLPDGTVLEAGGINGFNGVIAAAPAELYSPVSGTFSLTGPMITGREVPTATLLLPNGNVLLSGGDDGVNVLASTEVYYNTVAQAPVVITTTAVPNGFVSQPYVQMLLEQNRSGPITWSLLSGTLPAGITLGSNGFLTGTPTATGSFTFTVQVTDGISTASAPFTINVSLATLAFTSNTMPPGGAGRPYSQPLPVTGGTLPYTATVTAGSLPGGLSLSSKGVLSGTPSSEGSFTFTVNISDSSTPVQSATQTLTIAIDSLFITTTALPDGIVGAPYNATITATGGTLPLIFSSATSAFPPGLSIQPLAANQHSVALQGTPTLAGHYTFTESVSDSSNPAQTATQYYTMDVFPAGTAVPATVAFLIQPQNSVGGQILLGSPIRVHVADASNTPIVGASVALSFNGAPPCSTAVLGGALNAITNGAGNAVFPDLSIDRGQLGYTLLASAGSASAISQAFTVNGFCNTAGNMTVARLFNTATLLPNGRVLITGGQIPGGAATATAEIFDPGTGLFTATGNMTTPRWSHTATLLPNGKVLITGGIINSSSFASTASADLYDPATGAFTPTGNMNQARALHTATLLTNGTVLIAGYGQVLISGLSVGTAEIYDPTTGQFSFTGNTIQYRDQIPATLLANGTVLLEGGVVSRNTAELYNPTNGAFAATGPMTFGRADQAAVLLPNGEVLVAGGFPATGPIVSEGELFNPSTGTFSVTGSLDSLETYPAAAVLADGTALFTSSLDAEVYSPSTGTFAVTGSPTTARSLNNLVVLNNGMALDAGGTTAAPSAEIYYSTAPLAPIRITTASLFAATVNLPFTQILLEQGGLGNLTWSESGALPTGMNFSSQGILTGTPTVSGAFPLTFTVTDSSTPQKSATSGTLTLTVSAAVTPIVFAPQTLPTDFTSITSYAPSLAASGGTPPYKFAVTSGSLPAGITLGSNGAFSGTSTVVGSYPFGVTVTDSSVPVQTATQTFTIQVAAPLTITTSTLPGGTAGTPYSANISTTGGVLPVGFSITTGSLPPGLGLSLAATPPQTATLSGTPTAPGTFTFTITGTDSSLPPAAASQAYTMTVAPAVAPPANVVFVAPPVNSVEGQVLSSPVQVQVTDATNTPISNASVSIGFSGTPPCAAASLGGTLTQTTDGTGTATFSDLTINRGQFAYRLAASAGSVAGISNPFNIEGFCDTTSLATARVLHSAVALPNGLVLVAGGATNTTAATILSSAELYSAVSHSFSSISAMQSPRASFTMTALQSGLVLIAGGIGTLTDCFDCAELFDPSTNTFTLLRADANLMTSGRTQHTATLLPSGKVLLTGGINPLTGSPLATAELFDPTTNTFAATAGAMTAARSAHRADLLPNGQVLITGGLGSGNNNVLASAELYDPIANTFTATGSMATPRFNHASAVLYTGKLLVAGGSTPGGAGNVSTAAAELYDPSTGTFSATGSATRPLTGFYNPVPVLVDGTVFLADGNGNAQIYDPAAGTFRATGNMTVSQLQPQTGLLPDGTVLLAGGQDSTGTGVSNGEVFYPSFTPGIIITLTLLPNANQNQPYTQQLLEKGGVGTLTWALAAASNPLPPGLTLSSSGILSGTPTQFGGFPFTVQVTDSSVPPQTATITYGLVVLPQLQFVGTQLFTALSGTAYSNTLPLVGGTAPYSITLAAGTLPAGLIFTPASLSLPTGQISGTTTALGTYPLTFQASDSSVPPQSTTATLTIGVTTPLAITTTTLPGGSLGASYGAAISTTGGLGSVLFGLTAGTLPPGVPLSVQGVLSGTPTSAGTFTFTVIAADQSLPPQTATQAYTVTMSSAVAPISLTPNPLNLLANNAGNMTVTLSSPAGANGVTVTLASSAIGVAAVPASVLVPPNNTSATFQVTAGGAAGTATITASAPGATSGSSTVVVTTRPMALTTDGPLLAVSRTFNATVTLAQPAGPGGVSVSLSSNPSGFVTISPASQTISAGQSTAVFSLTAGGSSGGVVLTATASGYTNATAPLTVTSAVVSLQGVTVAPGQSNSLAVSLSQPAPAGGLTITLTSSAPGTATVTPSVFVPAGAQTSSANPQVTGILIGTATITGSAVGFAPDAVTANVTVTSTLSPNPVTVISSGGTTTVTLSISAPAPAGGIAFTLATDASGTATVPAQATVIQGATSVQFQITGGTVGSTTLRASSTGIVQATAGVNVNPAPQIFFTSLSIGQNLQVASGASLAAPAPLGGVTVTFTSSDATKVLLSSTGKDAGSASLQIPVSAGAGFIGTIFVYALQGTGTAQITISAPGYTTATNTVTMQPSGFIINEPGAINTTTFSGPTIVQVTPAILSPGTLNWAGNQTLRPGLGPFNIAVSLGTSSVGALTPATLIFNGGDSFQNTSFQPAVPGGTTTLNLGAQPAGFSTPGNFVQIPVSVTAPLINFSGLTIGNNLESTAFLSLGATPPNPVAVTLTADPTKLLLSKTGTDAGSGTVTFSGVTSTSVGTVWVYALQGTGTAQITISAPGYTTATSTVTMQPSGFIINEPGAISTTTFSAPTTVQVTPAMLSPGTLNWAGNQALRPGTGPFNISVSLGAGSVGTLTPATITFNGGDSFQNTSFKPANAGNTTLNLGTQPAGFTTSSNFQQISVAVSAPTINFANLIIGNNLESTAFLSLGATPPNPVTVTVTADPTKVLLSKTGTDAGSGTLTFTGVTSTSVGTVWVYALQGSGSTQVTISAAGYTTATSTVTLQPSGFIINDPGSINTTTFAAATTVQITPAMLSPGTLNWAGNQALRPGIGPFSITATVGTGSIGTLTPGTVTFNGGDSFQNMSFQPSSAGNTTITLGAEPAGFTTSANFQQIPVTVIAPAIFAASSVTIGLNLQVSVSVSLQNAPPNPITVTATSPNAAIATLSTDATLAGGATAAFTNVTSGFVGTLTIQGISLNTTQIKLQAPGYSDATINVTINPSAFIMNSPGNFTASVGSNTPLQIAPAVLSPATFDWAGNQAVRAGFTVSVSVASSDSTVGTISPGVLTFPGNSSFATTAFQAAGTGTATISVVPPAGFSLPANFQQITATIQ